MNQNTPNQQNYQTIQPSQATRLLNALKEELAQAKAAGEDSAKARQHYARAEQIKLVLMTYRQQQRQRAVGANGQDAANGFNGPNSTGTTANRVQGSGMSNAPPGQTQPLSGSGQTQGQFNQAQYPARNMGNSGNMANVGAGMGTAGSPGVSGAPGGNRGVATTTPGPNPNAVVTVEKYQELRKRLPIYEQKIRSLEASRRPDMSADEANRLKNEIQEIRLKYAQCTRYLTYMKNQLVNQAQNNGSAASGSTPQASTIPNKGPQSMPGSISNAQMGTGTPNHGVATPAVTNALLAASNANNAQLQAANQGQGSRTLSGTAVPTPTAVKQEVSSSNTTSRDAATGSGVNLSQVTKPSVPTLPISSSINVKPPNPVVMKPGANNFRPTLTGGSSTSMGQIVASPAITRMPTYEMASGGPMQDNSGRVLTKRKLTELVNSLGADEGDGKTTIDGDVEELLLDLADEFVSSVTSFACRLAKHRKADSVDVKDVQLHLERNWNIRIPGHASDEIRSTRKWQPSSAYNQKISGVDIVKSVNGNIN